MRPRTSHGTRGPARRRRATVDTLLATMACLLAATAAGTMAEPAAAASAGDATYCLSAAEVIRPHDYSEFANINVLMNEAITKGRTNGDVPGYQDALGRLALAPATNQCAQRFRWASLAVADATVAVRACQEIVGANPSVGGVNAFLVCITPVNAAAVAMGAEARAASNAFVAGNESSCAMPAANFSAGPPAPFTQYADAMKLTAEVAGVLHGATTLPNVGRAVAGRSSSVRSFEPTFGCPGRRGCDAFQGRFNGGTKVVYTDGTREYYDDAGRAVLRPPGPRDVATETVDTTVPPATLKARAKSVADFVRKRLKATPGRRPNDVTSSHAVRPRLAGRVLVVTSRRSGLAVLPPWLRALGPQLGAAQGAESLAARSLAGDPSVVLPQNPPAPTPITASMRVSPAGAAALNAVTRNQHARAVASLAAARAAEALRWMPDGARNPWTKSLRDTRRAELAARAAELSALVAAYPALARRAQAALRPSARARVAVVVSGPRVLQVPGIAEILSRGSSPKGAPAYAALAAAG